MDARSDAGSDVGLDAGSGADLCTDLRAGHRAGHRAGRGGCRAGRRCALRSPDLDRTGRAGCRRRHHRAGADRRHRAERAAPGAGQAQRAGACAGRADRQGAGPHPGGAGAGLCARGQHRAAGRAHAFCRHVVDRHRHLRGAARSHRAQPAPPWLSRGRAVGRPWRLPVQPAQGGGQAEPRLGQRPRGVALPGARTDRLLPGLGCWPCPTAGVAWLQRRRDRQPCRVGRYLANAGDRPFSGAPGSTATRRQIGRARRCLG